MLIDISHLITHKRYYCSDLLKAVKQIAAHTTEERRIYNLSAVI